MHSPKLFGENLRRMRRARGITQSELAARLYVSPQNISKWECGKSAPDVENLCLLADVLGVSVDQLLEAVAEQEDGCYMIGIDGGGTKTEFCLFDAQGHVLARERLEGSNPNVYGMEQAQATLKKGITLLMERENRVKAIFAGIAGCGVESNRRAILTFLKAAFPTRHIEVKNDAYNVIYSTPYFKRCIMAIMGTGSVVFAKTDDSFARLGGWGYLFDNGFSGYTIGRDALMAALGAEDGVGEPTVLLDMLKKELKGSMFESIPALYQKPKEEIASYAKLVFRAYEQGDAVAIEILKKRADVLRHQLTRAASLYDVGTHVVLAGGLSRDREIVLRLLDTEHFTYEFPALPPVYGACNYCARMLGEPPEDFAVHFEKDYTNLIKE